MMMNAVFSLSKTEIADLQKIVPTGRNRHIADCQHKQKRLPKEPNLIIFYTVVFLRLAIATKPSKQDPRAKQQQGLVRHPLDS